MQSMSIDLQINRTMLSLCVKYVNKLREIFHKLDL